MYSCSATKHLIKDNQSLLVSNNIDVKFTGKISGDKTSLKSELGNQVVYDQHPNKKFMSLFRLKLGMYTKSVLKNEKRVKRKLELDSLYAINQLSKEKKEPIKNYKKTRN